MPSYQLHRNDFHGISLWFYLVRFPKKKEPADFISLRSLELINASRLIWPDRLFGASQKLDCEHIKNMSVISCGERSAFSLVKAETGPVITEPQ